MHKIIAAAVRGEKQMSFIRKTARLLTLPVIGKEKRKAARIKTEDFLHYLFKTEYYRCGQIFNRIYEENRGIGFNKYHLISLGYNCFGRMTFNFWGLKPRKADGEQTMPFDIAIHPLPAVIKALETHFGNYFNVSYDAKEKYWVNPEEGICFVHDHEEDLALFTERYHNRIAAFDAAVADKVPCLFFAYNDGAVKAEDINRLHEVLGKICPHKKFKLVYMVFNAPLPENINTDIAVYRADYPQGYVHMDKFTKYKTAGLSFEKGVVEFTVKEVERLIK